MGRINALISSIFSAWKRKRGDDEEVVPNKKAKVANYTLTPNAKNENENDKNLHSYRLGEVLNSTEGRQVEYKEGGFLFKEEVLIQYIKKYASAFLNSEGGRLLAGITDNGTVRGVYISPQEFNRILNTIQYELSFFRPIVSPKLYSVKTYPVVNEKRTFFSSRPSDLCVLEIKFEKGLEDELYEGGDHLVYLRRDGGVHGPLRPLDIKNIVISKYNQTLKKRRLENQENNEKRVLQPIEGNKRVLEPIKENEKEVTKPIKESKKVTVVKLKR